MLTVLVFSVAGPAGAESRSTAACQFRLKIPHCTGRKFPTPEPHEMGLLGLGRSGAQRRLLARFGRNGVRGQGTS